jgi:hypothetical protein
MKGLPVCRYCLMANFIMSSAVFSVLLQIHDFKRATFRILFHKYKNIMRLNYISCLYPLLSLSLQLELGYFVMKFKLFYLYP